MLRKRPVSEAQSRLKLMPIRMQQRAIGRTRRSGIGEGRGANRGGGSEPRANVQIHQTPVAFIRGNLIVPAETVIQAQFARDAPVIIDQEIKPRRPEVLVGVPIGDIRGIGEAEQEIGQIETGPGGGGAIRQDAAGERAVENEATARILLLELVELLPPEIGSERNVVQAVDEDEVVAHSAGLIVIERELAVVEAAESAAERQVRRSVELRILKVALNAGETRNVDAVGHEE